MLYGLQKQIIAKDAENNKDAIKRRRDDATLQKQFKVLITFFVVCFRPTIR